MHSYLIKPLIFLHHFKIYKIAWIFQIEENPLCIKKEFDRANKLTRQTRSSIRKLISKYFPYLIEGS